MGSAGGEGMEGEGERRGAEATLGYSYNWLRLRCRNTVCRQHTGTGSVFQHSISIFDSIIKCVSIDMLHPLILQASLQNTKTNKTFE
jgi:hypothetical protein